MYLGAVIIYRRCLNKHENFEPMHILQSLFKVHEISGLPVQYHANDNIPAEKVRDL